MWVSLGVVSHIGTILHDCNATPRGADGADVDTGRKSAGNASPSEGLCMQAIITVGSFAYGISYLEAVKTGTNWHPGGPRYLSPLDASQIFPSLISKLDPRRWDPDIILATLRVLNILADCSSLEPLDARDAARGFLDVLYADSTLAKLVIVLEQHSSLLIVQHQVSLAAALIWKTCRHELQRERLASAGFLEALAAQLASNITTSGSFLPSQDTINSEGTGMQTRTSRSDLASILHGIACIIADSKDRTNQLICTPALATVFPWLDADPYSWRAPSVRAGKQPVGLKHSATSRQSRPNSYLTSGSGNLPPLNPLATWGKKQGPGSDVSTSQGLFAINRLGSKEDDETPLFGWLLDLIYAGSGLTRLMAAWVLSLLFRAGLASPRRERALGMSVIPIVARLLEHETSSSSPPAYYQYGDLSTPARMVKEIAPRVLALMVVESPDLQKAAAGTGIIKRLSQLLKQTHDSLPSAKTTSMWNPSNDANTHGALGLSEASRLGVAGLSPARFHTLQVREAVLIALAAMASSMDEYRKAIIDHGVVPFVVESLKPYVKSGSAPLSARQVDDASGSGNPNHVLLAACAAARALSRSVSTLRTSLMDAGLAAPLHVLLKSPVIEVQTAATAVIANIVLEFSPMRDVSSSLFNDQRSYRTLTIPSGKAVIDAGVLKVLCEHAHSHNTKLKLHSIWSLKHLVYTASNSLKRSCFEELGPDWLLTVLCKHVTGRSTHLGRSNGDDGVATISMGTPNAAGEQVDLLNAVDDEPQAAAQELLDADDEDDNDEDDEVNMIDSIGALSKHPGHAHGCGPTQFHYSSVGDRPRSGDTSEPELETVIPVGRDDVAVQEQGLDFVRNLICGPDSAEMIDFLLRELGRNNLFDMLASLLRPRPVDVLGRDRRLSAAGTKHVPPPTEIVVAVCYILAHLAAGLPRHRQLLLSQTDLLKALIPYFTHSNTEVRVCCAWIVINLTSMEDQADKTQSRNRALELSKLGILEQLRKLETDADLNVRERTKQAVQQMGELLQR